jgi:hypothetical protein
MTDNETLLAAVDDVVEVLRAGLKVELNSTDDPEIREQIKRNDKAFYAAARVFIDELRRQTDKRGFKGDELALMRAYAHQLATDREAGDQQAVDRAAAVGTIVRWAVDTRARRARMN